MTIMSTVTLFDQGAIFAVLLEGIYGDDGLIKIVKRVVL